MNLLQAPRPVWKTKNFLFLPDQSVKRIPTHYYHMLWDTGHYRHQVREPAIYPNCLHSDRWIKECSQPVTHLSPVSTLLQPIEQDTCLALVKGF